MRFTRKTEADYYRLLSIGFDYQLLLMEPIDGTKITLVSKAVVQYSTVQYSTVQYSTVQYLLLLSGFNQT